MSTREAPSRRLLVSAVVDIAVPVVVYYLARGLGLDAWSALLLGAVGPLIQASHGLLRTRTADWPAIIVLVIIFASIALSWVGGSPRFLLAKDGLLTAGIGVALLVSLFGRRPALFAFGRMMVRASGHTTDDWDDHWRRSERFRRVWRQLTLVWAIGVLLDSVSRVVLAYSLPIDAVPALSVALWLVLLLGLQAISQILLRRPDVKPLVFTG